MPQNFSDEQLAHFKSEFSLLTTFQEKLEFWKKNLGFTFSQYTSLLYWDSDNTFFEQSLTAFRVYSPTYEGMQELNQLLLNEIKELDSSRSVSKLLYFEAFKKKIDELISEAVRPIVLLEKELAWINELLNQNEVRGEDSSYEIEEQRKNEVKKEWVRGYNEYYIYGREAKYQSTSSSTPFLVAHHNGYEIARYREYIEAKLKNPSIKKVSAQKKEITLKQQLLLLRFTGLLDNLKDWKGKDKETFLAILLHRSPQNIKDALLNLYYDKAGNEIWTEENLSFVVDSLNKIGLKEKANSLDNELDKLRIRQKGTRLRRK